MTIVDLLGVAVANDGCLVDIIGSGSVMVQATSFDHVTINNQTNDVRLRQDVCLAVVSASKRCLS